MYQTGVVCRLWREGVWSGCSMYGGIVLLEGRKEGCLYAGWRVCGV